MRHETYSPIAQELLGRLSVPLVAAPMFLISGPQLVTAVCKAGAIGALPAHNARTTDLLQTWLSDLNEALRAHAAPYAVNLITHATNRRFHDDLEVVVDQRVPIVITSLGAPREVLARIHSYGGLVFADVASIHHARKAADASVDGLVLLCAGAGGNTGSLNPLAFVEAVRSFYRGIVLVAGAITNGRQIRALRMLGADLAYVGTPFIVAEESLAPEGHRRAIIEADADDVICTTAVSGVPANVLRRTLDGLQVPPLQNKAVGDMDIQSRPWLRTVCGAGHGVGQVQRVESAAEIVERFRRDFDEVVS
ncbi:MAG TPA: nitronate monooxygenase [Steroidobacter sp.]